MSMDRNIAATLGLVGRSINRGPANTSFVFHDRPRPCLGTYGRRFFWAYLHVAI